MIDPTDLYQESYDWEQHEIGGFDEGESPRWENNKDNFIFLNGSIFIPQEH